MKYLSRFLIIQGVMIRRISIIALVAGYFLVYVPVWGESLPLTPVIDVYPSSGQAPLTVLVSGNGSTGKWGRYQDIDSWEFDPDYDGENFTPTIFDPVFDYTYDQPGTYVCRIRITDNPNTTDTREAFLETTITVTPSTKDPGVRSKFPQNNWGAGINPVWANDEQLTAAADYIAPVDQIFLFWDDTEPSQHGVYDWERLDRKLKEVADQGRKTAVQINAAFPDWIFNHIAKTGTARGALSPQFWDPDYIQYYKNLISALADRIASSPYKDRILYIRQQWNAVHTETCFFDSTVNGSAMGTWVDNPDWVWPSDGHRYEVEWSEEIALDYERQIISHFISEFEPLGIGVALRLIWSKLPDSEIYAYFTNASPTEWMLQTDNTVKGWDEGKKHMQEFIFMRCFGALGFEETLGNGEKRIQRNPIFTLQQDIYGIVLRSLAVGLPYIGIYGDDLKYVSNDGEYRESFNFGNKYAGWHLYPKSAPGAWIVLGEFKGSTDWLWLNMLSSQNWGYFLRQNDPTQNTTPLFLVDGDSTCRFTLYARQINDQITFDIDDSFASAIQDEPVEVRVVFKESSGTFSLQADRNGTLEPLAEDRYEGHKGWRTSVFRIDEPRFADGTDGQTDLAIIPTSGTPIVHMIEIDRFSTVPEFDKGDTDGDYKITLKDAILAIRILSAFMPDQFVKKEADINADGKIGIEEVIFILRKISE